MQLLCTAFVQCFLYGGRCVQAVCPRRRRCVPGDLCGFCCSGRVRGVGCRRCVSPECGCVPEVRLCPRGSWRIRRDHRVGAIRRRRGHPLGTPCGGWSCQPLILNLSTVMCGFCCSGRVRGVGCRQCVSPEFGCVPEVRLCPRGSWRDHRRRGHPSAAVCVSCWCNHCVQYLYSAFCPGGVVCRRCVP